jgi:probable rRNA maturation factor
LGDICICKKVAFKQAKEYGNTKLREIVYMAVHGLLHLLGYDHMKDEDKKVMREVEEKIMSFINLTREER